METAREGEKVSKQNLRELERVSVRLVNGEPLYADKEIHTPEDACELLARELKDYNREVFGVLNLKASGEPINFTIATVGSLSEAVKRGRGEMEKQFPKVPCRESEVERNRDAKRNRGIDMTM